MKYTADTTLLWPFLVYGIAAVSLVGGILFISYFIGERHKEPATNEAYEGGIIATGTARLRLPVHFYIVAMFFVIFDIAAVFIMSWAISIRETGWPGYMAVVMFTGILSAVLLYIWRIGALNFGPNAKKILDAYHKNIKKTPYDLVDKQSK